MFKIVYHLLDKGRATASELAEKFEVSVRTIYRDIDALSGAGIPIYTEAGRNGGIYLMNDFVMDKAVLTEEEKREILTALHSINSTSNIDNSQILQNSLRYLMSVQKAGLKWIFPDGAITELIIQNLNC